MNINSVNYVNRSDNMRTASINIKSNQAADTADTAKALLQMVQWKESAELQALTVWYRVPGRLCRKRMM